jgi:hypothetical protein
LLVRLSARSRLRLRVRLSGGGGPGCGGGRSAGAISRAALLSPSPACRVRAVGASPCKVMFAFLWKPVLFFFMAVELCLRPRVN